MYFVLKKKTLMHKAERSSNYFFSNSSTYNQTEQIRKE